MKLVHLLTFSLISMGLAACSGENQITPESTTAPVATQSAKTSAQVVYAATVGTTTFTGKRANYSVVKNGTTVTVTDITGQEATKVLADPTRLVFADAGIAYDVTATAGQAYRVYRAAFNRTPDLAGLGYWIQTMDKGTPLDTVAALFINSPEFVGIYGANPTNQSIVEKFYLNVLNRPLDQPGFDFWVKNLNSGVATSASVLASFSESAENKAQVASAIAAGINYTIYVQSVPLPALNVATFASCPDAVGVQSQEIFSCMVGTMTGKTLFGGATCTLSIDKDGKITLASGTIVQVEQKPYDVAIYTKLSNTSPDAFDLYAVTGSFGFDLKVKSPKYAAIYGTTPGVQASLRGLSCRFDL